MLRNNRQLGNKEQDKLNLDSLKEIHHQLKDGDCSFFFQAQGIQQTLRIFTKEVHMMPPVAGKLLKHIADQAKVRIDKEPHADKLFKELLMVLGQMEKQYQISGTERNAEAEQSLTERLFQFFLQEYGSRPQKNTPYLVNIKTTQKRMTLSALIADTKELFTMKWYKLFQCAQYIIENIIIRDESPRNLFREQIQRKRRYQDDYLNQPFLDLSCLGCIPFFLKGWNIFDLVTNKTKIALIQRCVDLLTKDQEKLFQAKLKIRRQICGLLNTQGGVVLFDCERAYLNVIPRGEFLIRIEKEKIEKELIFIINSIKPKPIQGQNYVIDFVPMAKDPISEFGLKKQTTYPECLDSQVVVRITVRPSMRGKKYIYPVFKEGKEKILEKYEISYRYCSIFSDQESLKYSYSSEEQIVQKQRSRQQNEELTWVQQLRNEPVTCFDHSECQKCLKAVFLENRVKETDRASEFEDQYKYATAMVAKKQNLPQIKKNLLKQFNDIELIAPFTHLSLRGASATAILYHNDPFSSIQSYMNFNTDFEFEGRFVLVVSITDLIKLINRCYYDKTATENEQAMSKILPESDFNALKTWGTNEFKKEKIVVNMKYGRNENGLSEMFMQVLKKTPNGQLKVHRACTLLLYLVLNHHGEKAIMKAPQIPQNIRLFDYKQAPPSLLEQFQVQLRLLQGQEVTIYPFFNPELNLPSCEKEQKQQEDFVQLPP